MATKLFIVTQAPSAEVTVTSAKDVEGKIQEIKIGFRRYGLEKAQSILEGLKEVTPETEKEILKQNILYIKQAVVATYDEETLELDKTITVEDTRTAEPFAPFWESSKECLAVLLEHYLDSAPWKGAIITAFVTSLYNIDFKEAEAKNS